MRDMENPDFETRYHTLYAKGQQVQVHLTAADHERIPPSSDADTYKLGPKTAFGTISNIVMFGNAQYITITCTHPLCSPFTINRWNDNEGIDKIAK